MRSEPIRFEADVHNGRVYINDDDFGWDAALRIGGDFVDEKEKLAFANAICAVLNANEKLIPTRDTYLSANETQGSNVKED